MRAQTKKPISICMDIGSDGVVNIFHILNQMDSYYGYLIGTWDDPKTIRIFNVLRGGICI